MPRWFSAQELSVLDAPTASPFTMESVGGVFGAHSTEELPMAATESERTSRLPSGTSTPGFGPRDVDDDSIAIMEDTLERGESYEMRSQRPVGRRQSGVERKGEGDDRPKGLRARSSLGLGRSDS